MRRWMIYVSKNMYFLSNGYLVKATSMSQSLPPFRWYMTMNSRGSQTKEDPIIVNSARIKVHVVDDNATSIDALTVLPEQSKSVIYDLQGVKQNAVSRPGLYDNEDERWSNTKSNDKKNKFLICLI